MGSQQHHWRRWLVNSFRVKLALTIGLAVAVLFSGCAGQPASEVSVKQNTGTEAHLEVGGLASATPISKSGEKLTPRYEVEEIPAIQEGSAVFFTLGSAALNYKERQKLEVIAQQLSADRNQHVMLIGHANDNGSSSYNLAVSDSRVVAVAAFLRKHGVQNGRIRTQAQGSEKIPMTCRSSVCRQKSRRVDLVVSKIK